MSGRDTGSDRSEASRTDGSHETARAMKAARSNRTLAIACVAFVGCMVGAAYASVPLYQLFCAVTGYGGTTQRAQSAPVEPIERRIKVRFDGNVASNLPWTFKPEGRQVELNMGEVGTEKYMVANLSGVPNAGTATFNVTPFEAGAYFNKLDCFCFTEQALAAGEEREMQVVFFVDPAMDDDPNLKHIDTITLSYTFFRDEEAEQPVAAAPDTNTKNSGNL
nr:cytochrome c oxidase assembly protein [Breoghania sp.]